MQLRMLHSAAIGLNLDMTSVLMFASRNRFVLSYRTQLSVNEGTLFSNNVSLQVCHRFQQSTEESAKTNEKETHGPICQPCSCGTRTWNVIRIYMKSDLILSIKWVLRGHDFFYNYWLNWMSYRMNDWWLLINNGRLEGSVEQRMQYAQYYVNLAVW